MNPNVFPVMPMENVTVTIQLFATLRDECGVGNLEVKCNGTIPNLVEEAARKLGEGFLERVYDVGRNKVREDLIFSINGRNIKDIEGGIELKEGDRVAIFPPLAGG